MTDKDISDLMDDETWMTAKEAKEWASPTKWPSRQDRGLLRPQRIQERPHWDP